MRTFSNHRLQFQILTRGFGELFDAELRTRMIYTELLHTLDAGPFFPVWGNGAVFLHSVQKCVYSSHLYSPQSKGHIPIQALVSPKSEFGLIFNLSFFLTSNKVRGGAVTWRIKGVLLESLAQQVRIEIFWSLLIHAAFSLLRRRLNLGRVSRRYSTCLRRRSSSWILPRPLHVLRSHAGP
jgi:hypothetical protein